MMLASNRNPNLTAILARTSPRASVQICTPQSRSLVMLVAILPDLPPTACS